MYRRCPGAPPPRLSHGRLLTLSTSARGGGDPAPPSVLGRRYANVTGSTFAACATSFANASCRSNDLATSSRLSSCSA
ncbi:MAG: hypothetical protein ACK56F_29160, partial [bacterium]